MSESSGIRDSSFPHRSYPYETYRIVLNWRFGVRYSVSIGAYTVQRLLAPREAANILGVSYPTLKQWIYRGKIKTAKTPGGHHRVPESEIDRLIPKKLERGEIGLRRGQFRKISGRNQLIGRVIAIKYSGLLAQVTLAIGEQHITSIITADAAKEMRLKPGERAAALIKSTEVMILRV